MRNAEAAARARSPQVLHKHHQSYDGDALFEIIEDDNRDAETKVKASLYAVLFFGMTSYLK